MKQPYVYCMILPTNNLMINHYCVVLFSFIAAMSVTTIDLLIWSRKTKGPLQIDEPRDVPNFNKQTEYSYILIPSLVIGSNILPQTTITTRQFGKYP